jgi:diadenylate cyclase
MLEHIGQTRVSPFRFFIKNRDDEEENKLWMKIIDTICNATESLSATQTGALIVVERKIRLDDIVNTGTIIESKINEQLIENIFFKNAPLHDGGMVIRNGKIYAAGCVLPLSQNTKLSKDLGTRHRAALGISENSDAIVIVVSEETGIISVAQNGYLARKLSTKALKYRLEKIFCTVGTK